MDSQPDLKPQFNGYDRSSIIGSDQGEEQSLDLSWVIAVVRRRFPIMVVVALCLNVICGGLLVKESRKIIPEYEGAFRLLVEPVTAEARAAQLSLLTQDPKNIVKQGRVDIGLVDYESLIRILKSQKILDDVLEDIQVKYPDMNYQSLIGQLKISRISYEKDGKTEGTSLLKVSYGGIDTDKIQFILARLVESYLDYSKRQRLSTIKKGIDFIDKKLPEHEQHVTLIQDQIQRLRQQYNLINPVVQGEQLVIQDRLLKSNIINIEAKIAEKKVIYATMQKQLQRGEINIILGESRTPNTYQILIGKLQQVESNIVKESSQLLADSIPMQYLREEEENLRSLLRQEAQSIVSKIGDDIQALESQRQILITAENNIKEIIKEWPYLTRKYEELQQELKLAKDKQNKLITTQEELKIEAAQIEVPWQILSPPDLLRNTDGKPQNMIVNETKKKLVLVLVVSLLLSIGIGFLVEIMITVFHSPEEVKVATKQLLLGAIPFAKQVKENNRKYKKIASTIELGSEYASLQPEYTVSFLEAFRSLYTNIRLLGSKNRPIRSLAIGSAAPRDGKSTIAVQLAQTAAAIGERVLLVDADLRHPRLHQLLGVANLRGLSDAVKSDLSLNELIQQSTLDKNLFFLSAGTFTPDPIKLLSSPKMQYLMEQFQSFFDLVIYNTPPLVGLADGNLIAALTDGIILVVRLEKTDRSLVNQALEELKISRAVVLGVVANGVKGSVSNSIAAYQRSSYQSLQPDNETVL